MSDSGARRGVWQPGKLAKVGKSSTNIEENMIKHYKRIGEELGRGSFGVVRKCININTGKTVAIKSLSCMKVEKALKEAQHEIELLKIADSPWIVKYYECFNTETKFHIVLEYVEGGSLRSLITKFGVFPESLAQIFTTQIVLGLDYLHEKRIIHRDIKCGNILINKEGTCKLADFGTSILQSETFSHHSIIGSPFWMAPEAFLGEISESVDVWSLGCCIIEMITGKPPYWDIGAMAAMFRISEDEHPPIPENLSEDLQHFLHCCFQKNVSDRYTCKQLLTHPWISENMRERTRSVSVAEVPGVLASPNERKLSNAALNAYTDVSILGADFNEETMSDFLDSLDSQPDPTNIFENEKKTRKHLNIDELDSEELKILLCDVIAENSALRSLNLECKKHIGRLLNEKKKATTIAKKYREFAAQQVTKKKDAVAKLQGFKDHQRRFEKEELTSLRGNNQRLQACRSWLAENVIDVYKLTTALFNGSIAASTIRVKGLEGKMNISRWPKTSTKEEKIENGWVILNYDFLFCYENFDSEIPKIIIPLENTKIIKANIAGNHSEEIKRLQQKALQENVNQTVSQWMGETSTPPLKRRASRKSSGRKNKIMLPPKIHKMFIEDQQFVYELAVDKPNLLNVWVRACQESQPWYKKHFSQVNRTQSDGVLKGNPA